MLLVCPTLGKQKANIVVCPFAHQVADTVTRANRYSSLALNQ